MALNKWVRLVLKTSKEEASKKFSLLCSTNRWHIYNFVEPNKIIPPETVYLNKGNSVSVHFIRDPKLSLNYVVLYEQKAGAQERFEVLKTLQEKLEFYSESNLENFITETINAETLDLTKLNIIGLNAPQEFSAKYMAVFEKAFIATKESQMAAITLCGQLGWAEFQVPLNTLAEESKDSEVKIWSKATLQALTETLWQPDYDPQLDVFDTVRGTKPFLADVQHIRYSFVKNRRQTKNTKLSKLKK